MVGARFTSPGSGGDAVMTSMLNGASSATACESDTSMVIMPVVPTSDSVGVPVIAPVLGAKLAQLGLFWMLKVSVLPLGSAACGVNEYCEPATICVVGVPPMTGGRLLGPPVLPSSAAPPQPLSASTIIERKTICLPQIRMFGPTRAMLSTETFFAADSD